jgi:hypothetical protein
MHKERILIILYDRYLLRFALLEAEGSKIQTIGLKDLRVYRDNYDFSIGEYILQALTLWGKELGIKLVEEMVPIIPQKGQDGIDDIFIFTYKQDESLYSLTKEIFVFSKDIQREGALNLTKFIDFSNLLLVSFDDERTLVTRYCKDRRGIMKVVSEEKRFNLRELTDNKDMVNTLQRFESVLKPSLAKNTLMNSYKFPPFNISYQEECVIEYLSNISRLEAFTECKKLRLSSFGEGEMEDNVLVVGGDRARLIKNTSLQLLSILTAFNLAGNFSVYTDPLGFLDFLQKERKQTLSDQVYKKFMLDFWGKVIILSSKKGGKLDDIVADVDVTDGNTTRQAIPMFGRILKFTFLEKGELVLDAKRGFSVGNKQNRIDLKGARGNVVIDSRNRPVSKNFEMLAESDLVMSWLKGIEAVCS